MYQTGFDPNNPICPHCGQPLTKQMIVESFRYDEHKCTLNVYICLCGVAVGVVVMDEPDPTDPYVVKKI